MPLRRAGQPSAKKDMKLPPGAEINMAIPCGIRDGNKRHLGGTLQSTF